jgi:hypothetical protein
MGNLRAAAINSSLSVGTDVTGAQVLAANAKKKMCFQGQNPVNAGFFLTPNEAAEMIAPTSATAKFYSLT